MSLSEIEKFNHQILEQVKFHEVDLLGICNNAVYFNYFEDARVKYLQDLKKKYSLTQIIDGKTFFIMARNECDYISSATLDDELIIYTRIKYVKKSSFGFEHLVVNRITDQNIAKGGGVLVYIDLETKKSIPLPATFINALKDFEPEINIIEST